MTTTDTKETSGQLLSRRSSGRQLLSLCHRDAVFTSEHDIVDWLSSWMVSGSVVALPSSVLSSLSHKASCAELASAMYSASAAESATEDSFLFLQLIGPPLI